jgi:glyoxylase-like metal-dependent hydrolase (beta-lactamase superfamily II)
MDRLEKRGKIKIHFETHFHADFVSGHLDLSKKQERPLCRIQMLNLT